MLQNAVAHADDADASTVAKLDASGAEFATAVQLTATMRAGVTVTGPASTAPAPPMTAPLPTSTHDSSVMLV
ncbi:MAG: hypothetical protein AAF747_09710 [Planctomycetota bacterium]